MVTLSPVIPVTRARGTSTYKLPVTQCHCWQNQVGGGRLCGSPAADEASNKGARTERSIVNTLQAHGFAAVRVPLSGAVGGRFAGDIVLPLTGRDLCVEVKARADGFRELYCWLHQRDVLIVKADRREPLVVVRLSLAAEIAKLAV
jgi:hypothetical protein